MTSSDSLQEALQHVSKKDVLSTEASMAKNNPLPSASKPPLSHKQSQLIAEFTQSVSILTAVFNDSHFDKLFLFFQKPFQLYFMHFTIGLIRGIGFATGLVFVITCLMIIFKESIRYWLLAL